MARTMDETIREVTESYLDQVNIQNPPSPSDIQADILDQLRNEFDLYNSATQKNNKWKIMQRLLPAQIADIILRLYNTACIAYAGKQSDRSYDILAIYQSEGENEGIYTSDEQVIYSIAKQYCYSLRESEFKEILTILRNKAPRVTRCDDPNLIAVNNGIFNYDTKQLMPFTPDLVFITKSKVSYNPNAKNVVIHNDMDNTDWDVESWMDDLFEDPEIRETIWQILGAIIRPNVPWGKSAWFYSTSGNNGKGTLCELMRQLVGEGGYASIPLSDFGKDFMLEPLIGASAIIVDENDVGSYVDRNGNIKAVITNDVIQMNRKFKQPIAFQFRGFMVQCLNEFPRIKDKSDSFYRRQLFIPFTKCFTGAERKYIKYDYFHRKEVLEYVLFKVLNMNYYELSVPEACKDALEEYKEFNDPVRQFAEEIFPQLQWDLVPFAFLYDLYKIWFKQNSPNGGVQGRNTFINDILSILNNFPDWYCDDKTVYVKSTGKMDKPEWLIAEYKLDNWYNPVYSGKDKSKICCPALKNGYRGILRKSATGTD